MRYGLKQQHINGMLNVFASYSAVEKVILYGSRAKGNYDKGSDIDFTLLGQKINLSLLLKIENDLDDLLLPYKIDVSILTKIKNVDLVEHINRVGIVFYEQKKSE